MEFGISSASFYPQLTEKTVCQMAERGIPCAELFINTLSELEPAYLRELRAAAEGSGLRFVSLHPFTCAFDSFMLFTHYERRLEDALEWHRRYFEAANQIGARIFVFHGDRWRGGQNGGACSEEEYFERFARLRDLGRSYGVTVAQENVERCRSRDVSFLRRMAEYLDGDVSLVFDNKQAFRSGAAWDNYSREVGKYVVHVHISDNGPKGDCLPLGKGTLDVKAMLSSLRAQGFDRAVVVELYGEYMDSAEEVYESYEYLKRLKW